MGFDDVNQAADSLGGDWFKFENIGDTLKVALVDMETRDQRDPVTGEVKLGMKSKKPRQEWVVTGLTDDGDLVKCSLKEGAQTAAVTARAQAGAKEFEPNGTLVLRYSGDNKPEGAMYAYKEFEAHYVPPVRGFATGAEATTPAAPAQPATTPAAPAQPAPALPSLADLA